MKALVLYRPNSDHAREVESFRRDYHERTGKSLDTLDIDSREGQAKARAYDIVQYPAVLATREGSGQVMKLWQGTPMPTINDVSYYDNK